MTALQQYKRVSHAYEHYISCRSQLPVFINLIKPSQLRLRVGCKKGPMTRPGIIATNSKPFSSENFLAAASARVFERGYHICKLQNLWLILDLTVADFNMIRVEDVKLNEENVFLAGRCAIPVGRVWSGWDHLDVEFDPIGINRSARMFSFLVS